MSAIAVDPALAASLVSFRSRPPQPRFITHSSQACRRRMLVGSGSSRMLRCAPLRALGSRVAFWGR
eukprot:5788446-Prymnesium_polylepis.1